MREENQELLHLFDTKDTSMVTTKKDSETDQKIKLPKTVFVPILKVENFGKNMAIDDKNI